MAVPDLVDSAAQSAAAARRPSMLRQMAGHPSVVFGTVVLVIMLLLALLAPQLGTVDPAAIDPVWRNKRPGTERTLTLPSGEQVAFVHRMGTDSLGRDLYSRVVYGPRISRPGGLQVAALPDTGNASCG